MSTLFRVHKTRGSPGKAPCWVVQQREPPPDGPSWRTISEPYTNRPSAAAHVGRLLSLLDCIKLVDPVREATDAG